MGDTGLELEHLSPEKLANFIRGAAESGAVQIIGDNPLFELAHAWSNLTYDCRNLVHGLAQKRK